MAQLAPEELDAYERSRAKGTSHNLAMIFASGQAPRADRKDERWRACDESASFRRKVPRGKYQHGLARYPGDPEAFVSSRGEARRVADKRGMKILSAPPNSENPAQGWRRRPKPHG